MKELVDLYNSAGKDFLNNLFQHYVVVSEKVTGTSISFERTGKNELTFYKGNKDSKITKVERTLMKYYENAIHYIESVFEKLESIFPYNWVFCVQYFTNDTPLTVSYQLKPKNGLLLTHIQLYDGEKLIKLIEDPRIIKDWGERLGVSYIQPIFQGKLTNEHKEKIKDFLEVPKEEQLELFKTSSLAEFIISVLNPELKHTALQTNLTDPIDSIIFKFYKPGETKTISAKIIDPYNINLLHNRRSGKVSIDTNEILLLDVLTYIEQRGIYNIRLLEKEPDEKYIELISNLFNNYIMARGHSISGISIDKAKFAKNGESFDLNIDNIKNKTTKQLIEANPEFRDVFKVILGSFKKKRTSTGIFTPSVTASFNQIVDDINKIINTEDSGFKTFFDYLNVQSSKNDPNNE